MFAFVNRIRILHVVPGYSGGISSFVKNLMKEGASDGCSMDVASFGVAPEAFSEFVAERGGNVYCLAGKRLGFFESFARLVRLIRHGSYNVVHCHYSGFKSLFIKLAARTAGSKIIISHAHRSADKPPLGAVRIVAEQWASRSMADLLLACSDIAGCYIFGERAFECGKVKFMPNGVDFETCNANAPVDVRRHFGIGKDRVLIGHIGRFSREKNHDFILTLAENSPADYFFALFGDGLEFDRIKAEVERLGLHGRVGLFGRLDGVQRIIRQLDVLILPSLSEGLPTVVVEAQAAGVRAIVSSAVTKQVDLGLGLVRFIDLDSTDAWIRLMREKQSIPDKMTRFEALCRRGFTCESMRVVYLRYVNEVGVGPISC